MLLHHYFKDNDDPRNVECRVCHLLTEHGHIGSYYHRFVPEESTSCQCQHPGIQTRNHLLLGCPSYVHARWHLFHPNKDPHILDLFRFKDAWSTLAAFLRDSDAWTKASVLYDPD
ncbi:uncharacterized protein LAESUDRAFT_474060 [Laetiporus sulphureus 93-53]|uniref:Reverse transcriptase zinc-binding domain-containing protein n=1 Tax=Laetiporus sulphureus 93-53 TaxID=1314785 RepID=A0A165GCD9_9APHY|nr:uncharacterized protein LAESUDRAFT_474060 [Laetiporus sulphureus 93-53]KZT10152.1 hypothetical protein LAESUDRAFT_474060 [Laetiporus sulphureus 93-53]